MNNSNVENLLKETQEKIVHFTDNKDATVQISGCLFEVKSGSYIVFSYNFKEGRVVEGQAHKVGFTPIRLYDLGKAINQSVGKVLQQK
jgi:hypothetical protein